MFRGTNRPITRLANSPVIDNDKPCRQKLVLQYDSETNITSGSRRSARSDLTLFAGLFFEARKMKKNPEISKTKKISFVIQVLSANGSSSFKLKKRRRIPRLKVGALLITFLFRKKLFKCLRESLVNPKLKSKADLQIYFGKNHSIVDSENSSATGVQVEVPGSIPTHTFRFDRSFWNDYCFE